VTTPQAVDLPAILGPIRAGVDQGADLVNAIDTGIRSVLSQLPPEIVGGVLEGLTGLRQSFDDIVTKLGEILSYGGDPAALRAAGTAWATEIGGAAGALAGLATLDATVADNHWKGDAADAYRDALPPQQLALTMMKTAGDEVDATLVELANQIMNFWIKVALAFATLVASLLAAAASAAGGPVTAPLGLAAAGAGLGIFVSLLNEVIKALTDITNEGHKRAHELGRRLDNDAPFRGGGWPLSTDNPSDSIITGISRDGSITDTDDTDWHLK
jgi:hypothetical protein